jgi:glutathione S-transferase
MLARPGVEKGRHVPSKHRALDQMKKSEEELEKESKSNSSWILSGMAVDAKK